MAISMYSWSVDRELRVSDKCTLCAQLRQVGDIPACVRNCSGSVLYYGDINDPDSQVSQLLAQTPRSTSTPCGTREAAAPRHATSFETPAGWTYCPRTA